MDVEDCMRFITVLYFIIFGCVLHLDSYFQEMFKLPEPSGSRCEFIVYPYSGVRMSSSISSPLKNQSQSSCEVYIIGHMTKMTATPIYVKTFKNLLLQNQKSYDLDNWYATLGTQARQS